MPMKISITIFFLFATAQLTFSQFSYINPMPGSGFHYPETNIILKSSLLIDKQSVNDKHLVEITGSITGNHSWTARLSDDDKTIVIKPYPVFDFGETVTVNVLPVLRNSDGNVIEGTS